MVKMKIALIILTLGAVISSCTTRKEFEVQGTMVHAITKKPLQDLSVYLSDHDYDYHADEAVKTDTSGRFIIHKESKHSSLFLKVFQEYHKAETHSETFVVPIHGTTTIEEEFQPLVAFSPVFIRGSDQNSGWANVKLIVGAEAFLDYNERTVENYSGSAHFDLSAHGLRVLADKTFNYHIQYSYNGVNHSRIDSLHIKYPIHNFTDTIYY